VTRLFLLTILVALSTPATASAATYIYDVPDLDEKVLDEWETYPLLREKIRLRVTTLDGTPLAWVYTLRAYEGGLPACRHLGMVAEAAEAAGAPQDYLDELRGRPCKGIESDESA